MNLSPMRYKNYVWPHNPRVYTIEYERKMGVHKVPFGLYHLQDLGLTRRVMKGEGEFVGPGAYDEFKKLATVFYNAGPGVLVHPIWQVSNAYFVQLSLEQEPRPDYVRYTFTFWEGYDGYAAYVRQVREAGAAESSAASSAGSAGGGGQSAAQKSGEVWHTVVKGESLWRIAGKYGVGVSQVITLNPQIKNPNLIYPGEKVRVK